MDSWNQGRHQPSNSGPLLYQQTYQGKLATLRSLAAHIEGVSIINGDNFQPSLRTSDIEARCAWNDADSVTLTLHKLTPEQAIAALKAIKGA